jgi:hypothetical protein
MVSSSGGRLRFLCGYAALVWLFKHSQIARGRIGNNEISGKKGKNKIAPLDMVLPETRIVIMAHISNSKVTTSQYSSIVSKLTLSNKL